VWRGVGGENAGGVRSCAVFSTVMFIPDEEIIYDTSVDISYNTYQTKASQYTRKAKQEETNAPRY
jgi:hypothetical protein